ncbi:hypothetical protein BJX64DRAFT_75963 [Aspergillus heterothallicus]
MNAPAPRPPQRKREGERHQHRRSKMLQAHIIYRILLTLIALTTLILFIYVAAKFGPHDSARRYPVPITAAALALPFDALAFFVFFRTPTNISWIVGLDIIIAVLGIVGGFTVLFTHYSGGGPNLRPYGYADVDGVVVAMGFVLGSTRLIATFMVCCCSRCGGRARKDDERKVERRRREGEMDRAGGAHEVELVKN